MQKDTKHIILKLQIIMISIFIFVVVKILKICNNPNIQCNHHIIIIYIRTHKIHSSYGCFRSFVRSFKRKEENDGR